MDHLWLGLGLQFPLSRGNLAYEWSTGANEIFPTQNMLY